MSTVQMAEAELQALVVDTAHVFGWVVAHFRPGLTQSGNWRTPVAADGKGFPDLVLCRDRVIFCELKSTKGVATPEQVAWGNALTQAGAEFVIWRPEHWTDGTIECTLRKHSIGSQP